MLAVAGVTLAQQISATLMGVVKDRQGAVVPNAKVVLINQEQRTTVRELNSEPDGSFTIAPLQPAAYTLQVEAPGFKKFEQKDIRLYANDRISVPNIVLEVGALTETVTVEAQAVTLKTESAEKSGVVTGTQVVNLALNGRNYLDLVKTIPGIQAVDFNGQVAGPGGIGNIYANGQRGDQNNVTLDGADNMDTGSNGTQHTSLNIDAIAEFKVITNSQPAEFGRAPGAAINVVTKSGTQDFHGTGYWFHRNEGMNAQSWRNNADGITSKKKYRYNYEGFNIGGPIYIPGKFNSDKTRLFFFVGYEWQEQLVPNSTRYVTVPTEAERQGDFSLTHEGDGKPVIIKDPLNNGKAFPLNKIPQERWNADGAKILNWFPLPNTTGFPDYNYQTQVSSSYPRRQLIVRGDWNISDKWRAYVRLIKDKDDQVMPYGQWNADYNIPLGPLHFGQPGKSMILNLTTIVNPTLTNEFIFGPSMNKLDETLMTDAWQRSKLGLSYTMPFPAADSLGLVQNWWFGGVPNQPLNGRGGFSGTPFLNYNDTFDFTDNLSKVVGRHQFKTGFFIERSRKDQTSTSSVSGNIYFDRDSSNPGDTNWAYSNALLGNYQRLNQANVVLNGKYRYTNVEWYVSDVFKVTQNLTLDVGLRFYIVQPQFDAKLQTASFNPALWDPGQAAKLWQKAINPATKKTAAYNPVTGQYGPFAMAGALVDGTGARVGGAYVDGIGMAGYHGYPRGLINGRNVNYAPRLGIAYSPGFLKNTVFRAGGGVFYERIEGNPIFDQLNNPPGTITPTLYYGNLNTIGSTQGVLFPQSLRGLAIDGHLPTTYNYNAGIQRELPFAILLDVGYAGSISRHLAAAYDINRPGFGSAWQPYSQDPTNSNPKFDGTTNLPVNFYRPYPGYGSINITQWGATSNYNSLQVGANRRLSQNLQFGVAYTWSRVMGTAGGYGDGLHPTNARMYNYAPLSFDRTHYLVINYIYNTPKVAKNSNFLDNPIGRGIFNNWVVSGITTMTTGAPASVGWGISGMSNLSERWTGDPTLGARVAMTGTPAQLPRDKRSLYQYIDPAAFRIPDKPSIGLDSAQRGYIHQPGDNNWDVSVFKQFPFSADGKRLIEARLEMFNAPNHTRFSGFNTGITFNSAGKVTNLPTALGGGGGKYGFGAINATRDPRIIQLAAKIYF